ncbi:tetratricopeptide repeat protein [Parvularcula flava]|uniref:Tetratricopeptide repeat protein n=1 Tax=Aquisalinus luteolus TaxID=1566827 RepID=A0A8J3A5X6_9PROT|nr:tetratricopeptide repeat protein [Aquisalinus luteolus]NHK26961.1 tetratricopeptide repeat protein [Aquisalinus luteolus]GGH93941.1 hypothetical protein GCM10011355_06960 [Aquisalinus luteolus]
MRFFTNLLVLLMVAFCGYSVWALKVDGGFTPPIPRDQLAVATPEITSIMDRHRESLATTMSDNVVPQIDESLQVIADEYGENSPQHIQALSDASIMLAAQARNDLAERYMQEAAAGARVTYGDNHRETALILHDLANLKISNKRTGSTDEAVTILEEIVDTRSRILDADHAETRGARLSLADALFTKWLENPDAGPSSDLLIRAEEMLEKRTAAPDETPANQANAAPDRNQLLQDRAGRLLYARINFAQQDYEQALAAFNETLTGPEETEDPQIYLMLSTAYSEQIASLRHLGREDEAEALRAAINRQIQAARVQPQQQAQQASGPVPQP